MQGSDVNADCHSHAYSPLHFAALSSNLDATQLLLDNGAKTYKVGYLCWTMEQDKTYNVASFSLTVMQKSWLKFTWYGV